MTLVFDSKYSARAEVIRDKGTNRKDFSDGNVEKYTWKDIGSSYVPGEIIAAFLWAQLEKAEWLTKQRNIIWNKYHSALKQYEEAGRIRRPVIPKDCTHNSHMYFILLKDIDDRNNFIASMSEVGINCAFHYVPLHSSKKGISSSRFIGDMNITQKVSGQLVRLPFWISMNKEIDECIDRVTAWLMRN